MGLRSVTLFLFLKFYKERETIKSSLHENSNLEQVLDGCTSYAGGLRSHHTDGLTCPRRMSRETGWSLVQTLLQLFHLLVGSSAGIHLVSQPYLSACLQVNNVITVTRQQSQEYRNWPGCLCAYNGLVLQKNLT